MRERPRQVPAGRSMSALRVNFKFTRLLLLLIACLTISCSDTNTSLFEKNTTIAADDTLLQNTLDEQNPVDEQAGSQATEFAHIEEEPASEAQNVTIANTETNTKDSDLPGIPKESEVDKNIVEPALPLSVKTKSEPDPDLVYLNTGREKEEIQSKLDKQYPGDKAEFKATKQQGDIELEMELFGQVIPPGSFQRLKWAASQSYEGGDVATPVLVAHGSKPGKTLCLTAAVHGDELNGIEIIRRVFNKIKPEKLSGKLIGIPIVNLQAFRETSRYLPDRRDLNRFFPGNSKGSSASRIASSLFTGVIQYCDALVDLHTGSFRRTNLPQLRADLNNPQVLALTRGFGATVILHSDGGLGTLRRAATDAGIPAVTLEAGEPMRLQENAIAHGVKGIRSLLSTMDMYRKPTLLGTPKPTFYHAKWIRSDQSGILFSQVKLGKKVKIGDILGIVTDPINNNRSEIKSPFNGLVLGMALNQLVMPGYATFRIGIQAENADMVDTSPDEFEDSE
ncbi:MAG: succinylglutamate desuccinylase/aspartoacylase family protein [Pseudomonadales bacterium]|nr:succinylglutamate desuccinylase/aspartoacylase family protein [Pseudomonadales bacterium]